jgi:hypothetical protein
MVGGLRVGNATGISLTVDSDGALLGCANRSRVSRCWQRRH